MEAWIKVQINWMYLHPIFDSRDIAKQLPSEAKKFREVNSKWRNLMKDAKATKNVIKLSKRDERLDELRHSHEVLEAVQKGLRDYLETKRSAFSRFYFLSDEELLSILSDTKDPTLIQHHIKKVFENI